MSSPKLTIVDTVQGIEDLRTYLADKEYVAFDTETTGLTRYHEVIGFSVCASEDEAYYIILARWDSTVGYLCKLGHLVEPAISLLEDLKTKSIIGHNVVFDCKMIESNFKVRLIEAVHTDTLILAHVLNENRRCGLKELGSSMFGESSVAEQIEMKASVLANGGKLTKACYELYKADPYLLGKYGAKDAWLTYKLFNTLVPQLFEQNLDKFFYEDESMPLLKGPTYEMNTTGLMVDTKALTSLKKSLEAECAQFKAFVNSEILAHVKEKYPGTKKSTTFNMDSPQQLSWLMFGKLNLEFSKLTKGGKEIAKALSLKTYSASEKRNFISTIIDLKGAVWKPECKNLKTGKITKASKIKDPWAYIACDKTDLKKYAKRYKWIKALSDYRQSTKLLDTYVIGIEEGLNYGIIQPNFLQEGTTSGRYSSRQPNFQNLPRTDKRVKSCIVPRPGNVFVGADYSQLEPRVFASVSQDPNLMKAFNGTDDFYSVIGLEVFNITDATASKEDLPDSFKVKYPELRDATKVIALASVYGASAWQLAKATGKSEQDTQEDIDSYFEKFPDVADMMLVSHEMIKKDGYVTSILGRVRRIPEAKLIPKLFGNIPHAQLDYTYRKMLNLSVNHRIQGTAANIVNRAMIKFTSAAKAAGIEAKMVAQIHDEIVVECSVADSLAVSALLRDAMENTTTLPGVPLEAIPRITNTFAK